VHFWGKTNAPAADIRLYQTPNLPVARKENYRFQWRMAKTLKTFHVFASILASTHECNFDGSKQTFSQNRVVSGFSICADNYLPDF
jgi:hypothetical protein